MRILLIRLSSFGDILFVTPALTALKAQYPAVQVDVAVYERFLPALACHPLVDRVLTFPKRELEQALRTWHPGHAWRLLRQFRKELRSERYDAIIDLHNVTDSAVIAWLAKGGPRTGHRRQLLSLLFRNRLRINDDSHSALHHSALTNLWYLQTAGLLPAATLPDQPHLEFHLPPEAERAAAAFLEQRGLIGKRLAGINPCSSYPYKRWHEAGFASLGEYLHRHYGMELLVFGGPQEQDTVQQVLERMKAPGHAVNLPLFQAFALIKRLSFFLSNDSGPAHVASAWDIPQVVLYGASNYFKFYPLSPVAEAIHKPNAGENKQAKREGRPYQTITRKEVQVACDRVWQGL